MADKPKNKFKRLDLGCGQRKQEGFFGVDVCKVSGVDLVHDLTKTPWPFKAESCEEIYSSHFFEHLTGPQRVAFMEEAWRILTVGSKMRIIVPYYASMRAVQDPYHCFPPVCEASFLYFNREWRKSNLLDHYPITCDFDFVYGYALNMNQHGWANRSEETRNFALTHYINVAADLDVTLTKRA